MYEVVKAKALIRADFFLLETNSPPFKVKTNERKPL